MGRKNSSPGKRKLTSIFVVIFGLMIVGYIHIGLWPRLLARMDGALSEGTTWSNIRLCLTMGDGVNGILRPHAVELMNLDSTLQDQPFNEQQLTSLLSLPGVKDAFYLNLEENRSMIVNSTIPVDSLFNKLDKRGSKLTGGASRMMRRLVGGLTRTKSITTVDGKFPLLVRYVGTYYPSTANEIIGIVIDESWFIGQVPATLDSLYRESQSLLFAAPALPDTNWNVPPPEDIYAAPGGFVKQTLGAIYKQDTLWWAGDPKVDAFSNELEDNYRIFLSAFNVNIGSQIEFPTWREEVLRDFRRSTIFLIVIEALGIALIVILWRSSRALRKQAKRNQIALSHLAHAVKTPVSRIRLNVDTLTEDMVVSPDDEKSVLRTISGECERMELAVKGAAMSLQQGRNIIQRESVDLLPILTKTLDAWDRSFESAGIAFTKDIKVSSLQGSFDTGNIAVAVDNVLDNALRHTILNKPNLADGEAKVAVVVGVDGSKAFIQVEDTGTGIPKSERKQIFERFQRAKNDAATGVSGLGLGLALVKEIVEAHDGTVAVDDSSLGGAKFSLTLPIR